MRIILSCSAGVACDGSADLAFCSNEWILSLSWRTRSLRYSSSSEGAILRYFHQRSGWRGGAWGKLELTGVSVQVNARNQWPSTRYLESLVECAKNANEAEVSNRSSRGRRRRLADPENAVGVLNPDIRHSSNFLTAKSGVTAFEFYTLVDAFAFIRHLFEYSCYLFSWLPFLHEFWGKFSGMFWNAPSGTHSIKQRSNTAFIPHVSRSLLKSTQKACATGSVLWILVNYEVIMFLWYPLGFSG